MLYFYPSIYLSIHLFIYFYLTVYLAIWRISFLFLPFPYRHTATKWLRNSIPFWAESISQRVERLTTTTCWLLPAMSLARTWYSLALCTYLRAFSTHTSFLGLLCLDLFCFAFVCNAASLLSVFFFPRVFFFSSCCFVPSVFLSSPLPSFVFLFFFPPHLLLCCPSPHLASSLCNMQ